MRERDEAFFSDITTVYVDVHGFRDLQGRFTRATDDLIQKRSAFMHRIGKRYVKEIKAIAPEKSGEYKETIQYDLDQQGKSKITLSIRAAYPLTKWIVSGTKPHRIQSREYPKGRLRFEWEDGPKIVNNGRGKIYYFKSVWHPGTKANPIFRKASRVMQPILDSELNNMATKWSIKLGDI